MAFPFGVFVILVATRECALTVVHCARFHSDSWRRCTLSTMECAVTNFEALLGQGGYTRPRIDLAPPAKETAFVRWIGPPGVCMSDRSSRVGGPRPHVASFTLSSVTSWACRV
jgi:hypothetical protein